MGSLMYSTIKKWLLFSLQILIILSCAKTRIEITEQDSDAFRTEDQVRNIAVNAFEKFYGTTKSKASVILVSGTNTIITAILDGIIVIVATIRTESLIIRMKRLYLTIMPKK